MRRIKFDNRFGTTFTIELVHEIWCKSQKCKCREQKMVLYETDQETGQKLRHESTKTVPGSITIAGGTISRSFPAIVVKCPGVAKRLRSGKTRIVGMNPKMLAELLKS